MCIICSGAAAEPSRIVVALASFLPLKCPGNRSLPVSVCASNFSAFLYKLYICILPAAWTFKKRKVKPPRKEDLLDLGKTFGMSICGSDSESDSNDEEFAPGNETFDSEGNT